MNLQGIIYEMGGDINNAFIAYRNAADVYLQSNDTYYGVELPGQLKKMYYEQPGILIFK